MALFNATIKHGGQVIERWGIEAKDKEAADISTMREIARRVSIGELPKQGTSFVLDAATPDDGAK